MKYDEEELQSLLNSVGIIKSYSIEDSVFYKVWLTSKTFEPTLFFWPTPLFDPGAKILGTHATHAKCLTHVTHAKVLGPTPPMLPTPKFLDLRYPRDPSWNIFYLHLFNTWDMQTFQLKF